MSKPGMQPGILPAIITAMLLLLTGNLRAETLRMVTEHWPPYADESLPGKGLAIELVDTAFARAGYETRLKTEDWPRALEGVRIGVYDVVASIWYSDERARDLAYSEPYLVNDIRFVKRKDSEIRFAKMDDLKGRLIGVIKDYAYPRNFAAANQLTKIANPALLPALGELVNARYDLVIGDKRDIDYTLAKFLPNESKNLEILPKSVGENKLYVAVSRANPQHEKIVKDFNRALHAMKKDGSYRQIVEAHRPQP
jgi:polar amino acid transport system substrate-binding protein